MARTALMNVMVQAAVKAGRSLARDIGEISNLQVSVKGPADFVSAADRRAEKILVAELSRARPSFGVLAEESGFTAGSDKAVRWIIDPLDGTLNFLHGIPLFAISIGLEREGEIVAGLVYNPVSNELFTAEKGTGAFLNDRRLRVSARTDIANALFATGIPHRGKARHERSLRELAEIMRTSAGVRRCGAASLDLAWVAAGRFDGFWEHALAPWDMAAGLLLIREAGGLVTDAGGGSAIFDTGSIVAGNAALHPRLLEILAIHSQV